MKSIGFFGGSFDPIHFGHIALAIQLMETHQLDEVLFCPAFCSPFKMETPPLASPEHRLEMLKLALDYPPFKICSLELDRKGASFTVDTIRELKKDGVKLRLLLSDEAAQHLHKWKDTDQLVKMAPPLIGPRDIKISSTEIRSRLKKKLYCGHLVPAKALDYIQRNHLYS
ncbi:MAG: nicotinate-nicotinamide nucleotide adenylyltransferase [Parachlamydiales bacterium]|nr:nicotinate-nicotinamide nucleotide adenylyltransferase [Parachlamydiales bacterium]